MERKSVRLPFYVEGCGVVLFGSRGCVSGFKPLTEGVGWYELYTK